MLKKLVGLLVVALLAGCGGGGEESSTDGIPASYTGSRSMAAITPSNARSVVTSAYSGTVIAGSLDVLAKAAGDDSTIKSPLLEVVDVLENATTSATAEPKTSAKSVAATASDAGRIYGYSGYFDYDITMDSASGDASGAITFVNFRPTTSAVTVDGSFTFSGVFNRYSEAFTSLKITLTNINISSGSTSYTISGRLEASRSGGTKISKMTLAVTNNATNQTGLLKDYTLTLSNNSSLTCTGALYDPNQGYVTISTPSPLGVTSITSQPTSGRLLATGSNGTKARLTFDSGGYYSVGVDATGNGTFVAAP